MECDNEKIDWLKICSQNNIEASSFTDFIKEKITQSDSIQSNNNNKDYISIMNRMLNNFSQLSFVTESIPDRKFCCEITYKGKHVKGIGSSKKEAKQNACKQLYEIEIGHEDNSNLSRSESEESTSSSNHSDSFIMVTSTTTTSDESHSNVNITPILALPTSSSSTKMDYISDLQIFCSKNKQFINMPSYTFKQIDRIFYCTCFLQTKDENNQQSFNGQGNGVNMKEAKKQAAQQTLMALKTFLGQKLYE
ncbi:hypothetical protein BLA29_006950 [Euroglyphus maynei]|uniref:DRBM domain-containing protein n=1 Tax=Euroglyphus maynei TaxID=6958 RepID=A0A1Y3ASS8_EURMA|nr:hypothetical protein BLA29_006950 [Euroglyphus maynei]